MQELLDALFALMESGQPPDPSAGLFGASIPADMAGVHIIGVPWDATTSYGRGTWRAPEAIRRASHQLDLMDHRFGQTFRKGIALLSLAELAELNEHIGEAARAVIAACERGESPDASTLSLVNRASEQVNDAVYHAVMSSLAAKKLVGLLGGDHSTPFGALRAMAEHHAHFGVLHIDAHHDLREAYEGFTHSHASIFFNVLQSFPQVECLVSIGVRDFSTAECAYARSQGARIQTFYDEDLFARAASGQTFAKIVEDILAPLPAKVYLSLDIDGLAQPFCPHTGTPVPGGLSFQEMVYLLHQLASSGRQIIGFDLVEVSPGSDESDDNEWDANVGARLLYKLCGAFVSTQPP